MAGLSGTIKFDHQGFRTDFDLDIIELNTKEGLIDIGTWNSIKGINFTRSDRDVLENIVESLQNKTLRVTTILVRKMIIHNFTICSFNFTGCTTFYLCTPNNVLRCFAERTILHAKRIERQTHRECSI